MGSASLIRVRRWVAVGMAAFVALAIAWIFAPGLPVLWGPWASAQAKEAGQELFTHEWQPNDPEAHGDGLGPVFNARSCASCHFEGGLGGAGTNQHNVLSFEVQPTTRDPEVHNGVVHAGSVDPSCKETETVLHRVYPVLKGSTRVVEGCTITVLDFDPVRTDRVSTPPLFGLGWVDRIPSNAITSNRVRRMVGESIKEFQLDFDSIGPGRPHVLADGRIGKFGWKAQFATLKEFVAAACANELGLSNPLMDQAKPLGTSATPPAKRDLDSTQFTNLVAFVDTLPRPVEVEPADPAERSQAARGKQLFGSLGCAVCHVPDMGGVKGVYSDFLLHDVTQPMPNGGSTYRQQTPELPLPCDHPKPEEWKTPPLWGVADSAPYFHDGGAPTLRDAILRHGMEAGTVTKAYQALPKPDQDAVVAFLKTLKAPPDALPAPASARARRLGF
jgi:CxxC motif-containing protein (DUF1111 family)